MRSQRKDERYATRLKIGQTEKGAATYKYIYANTEAELNKKKILLKAAVIQKRYTDDRHLTVEEWSVRWRQTFIYPYVSESSKYSYDNIFKNHISNILKKRLSDITVEDVQNIINSKDGHYDIQRRIRLYLKQMFSAAQENKYINTNPCQYVKLPRKPVSSKRPLTNYEKQLISKANFSLKQRAFVYLLLYTGVRRGEALALSKSDIDFDSKKIHIHFSLDLSHSQGQIKGTKTLDGDRWLDILDPLFPVLHRYVNSLPTHQAYLFTKANGSVMSNTAFRRFWEGIIFELNLAGEGSKYHLSDNKWIIWDKNLVDGLTPHIFRHNFATMLYYSDIDIKEAVRLMGHADEKMILEIYAHLDLQKSKSRSKLNDYISKNF